jgi:hypothetical protein
MAILRDILAKAKTGNVVEVVRRIYEAEAEWLPEAVANVMDEPLDGGTKGDATDAR